MASRGFKWIKFLCDNPEEGGTVAVIREENNATLEDYEWLDFNLEISDCSRKVVLDFRFKSLDGYNQRMDKLNALREALDVLESQMEKRKKEVTKPTLNQLLGGK